MADRGARHLVLVGRGDAGDEARPVIEDLVSRGIGVHTMRADVSDAEQVARIIATIDERLPPLRGIIHSAGVVDDAVALQQTWERMARVMAAKVRGSWHLHQRTRERALDFVALFSTGVSMTGSAGQANHAAANAFVDVLAPWLRARGVPAVAVNWGAWGQIGAAVGRRLSNERGIVRMSPADGLAAFERILLGVLAGDDSQSAQIGVVAADWQMFLDQFGSEVPPLYREIARAVRRGPVPAATAPHDRSEQPRSFARELQEATASRRPTMLRSHIRGLAAAVLGIPDAATLEWQQPLRELGLDSLMAVQLRNELAKSLERPLPATLLFECPTLKALVDFVAASFEEAPSSAPLPGVIAETAPDDVSEDQLAAALAARIEQIGRQ
jgi:NAD(P)-dependent dehydrogenase (short-subunit alcohol dehydrogenase family)/acyl carrier protein